MRELAQIIPNIDALLVLASEELGSKLLFLMRRRRGMLHLGNSENELQEVDAYRGRWAEAGLAFVEAWSWLEAQGLLVPADGTNGSIGWRRLSRRAQAFESEVDVMPYAFVRRLPKEALHPAFATIVWAAFMRGEYDVAVLQAMKAVEVAVRQATNVPELGVRLMRKAFDPKTGPLTDMEADEGEREARSALFAGAIGSFKNPHSHRDVGLNDPAEAVEIVMLANHLLRIVDSRKAAKP